MIKRISLVIQSELDSINKYKTSFENFFQNINCVTMSNLKLFVLSFSVYVHILILNDAKHN